MATEIAKTGGLASTVSAAANLAQLFLGSQTSTSATSTDNRGSTTVNSGGTTVQTTQTSVDPAAVQATINSILSGTSGLAAVASGQKTAGLYNSSTNQLLVNDLITRAAGEAASLNKTQTTTTVTPQTTQATQNTGGTTTSQTSTTPAKVNPSVALGGIAALQLIPKDIKDSILGGLKLNSNAASDSASASADAIADAYNDPSRAQDIIQSTAGISGVDNAQVVSGIDVATNAVDAASNVQDVAGGYDLTSSGSNFSDSTEGTDLGLGDLFGGIDGLDLGTTLGGALSGVGQSLSDLVSGATSAASSFFDDFDFGFKDGGLVSAADRANKLNEHARQHYANGGSVQATNLTDLAGLGYIANTGIKREGAKSSAGSSAESNDAVISRIIREQLRPTTPAVKENNNLQSPGKSNSTAAGYNSSSGESTNLPDAQVSADPNSNPDALVSGISNVLGINQTAGKAGLSGLAMLAGIPGAVGSLANAGTKTQAVNATIAGAASIVNPVLGLIVGGLLSKFNTGTPGDTSTTSDARDPAGGYTPSGTVTAGAAFGGEVTDAAIADSLANGTTTTSPGGYDGGNNSTDGSAGTQGGLGGAAGTSADGSFASGGHVKGPGTGTSDSIPARLSDGEYVIPADVVEALGIEFFDSVKNQFHKKVA